MRCRQRRRFHHHHHGGSCNLVTPFHEPAILHLVARVLPPLQLLRLRKNLSHFRFNYALVALLTLFLSLIFHPFSLPLFVFTSLAWYALHFSRDSSIVLIGRVFDDRVIAAVFGLVTIIGLVLTGVGLNVLVALLVSVFVIEVPGVFRNSEICTWVMRVAGEGRLASVASSQVLRSFAQIGCSCRK